MDEIVDMVFQLSGLNPHEFPLTLAEMTPWLARITVGCTVISGVFGLIGKLAETFFPYKRWR